MAKANKPQDALIGKRVRINQDTKSLLSGEVHMWAGLEGRVIESRPSGDYTIEIDGRQKFFPMGDFTVITDDGEAAGARLMQLPPAEIVSSPTNPRRRRGLEIESLQALAANIKVHGVLQPILVRLLPATRLEETVQMDPRPGYEIVAGERRWRAATLAELDAIPVLVRDLTDAQVLEMQLVENIEREDLDPMEEAEGFELLRSKLGYTVAQIAERIAKGKGESYVYKRLTLNKLVPEVRQAMYDTPALDVSVALLIARYRPEQQLDALEYVRNMAVNGEPASFRSVQPALAEAFHLVLAHAVFDVTSEDLVLGTGSCTACPKRSGNQGDIFGDATGPDSCTDTGCFQAKRAAHAARVRTEAANAGYKVIDGGAALMAKGSAQGKALIGYQRLDAVAYTETGNDGREREVTFGDALRGMGKKAPKHRVFIDPHTLEPIPVITNELAEKLAPKEEPKPKSKKTKAGKDSGPARAPWDSAPPADSRPPEEQALDNHQVQTAVLLRMFEAIRAGQRTADELRLAVKVLILDQDGADMALDYMGYQGSASPDGAGAAESKNAMEVWIDALLPEQLGQLLAMAAIEISFGEFYGTSLHSEKRAALIKSYGIDIVAVQAKVAEDLERQSAQPLEEQEEAAA